MKKLRTLFSFIAILVSLSLIAGMTGCLESKISKLEVAVEEITVDPGKSISRYLTVTATEPFTENDIQFISEDESIATVKFDKISLTNYIYFTVTGVKSGTTTIYFKSADGLTSSESITVTVTGAANTQTNASSSTTDTSSAQNSQSSDKGTDSDKTESSQKNTSSSGNSVTVPDHNETGEDLVWVPVNGGTKYHSKSSCSKMKNPKHVTKETAESNGYTPCKKCY